MFVMKLMLALSELELVGSKEELAAIPEGKVLINTINAHSYNVAQKDPEFAEAIGTSGDGKLKIECGGVKYLIPDGSSIVKACRWLKGKSQPKERIAGWDLFAFEMQRMNGMASPDPSEGGGMAYENETLRYENKNKNERSARSDASLAKNVKKRVMFMGSSEKVLRLIRERVAVDYPNLEVVTYSPPYKKEFSEEDNQTIIKAINEAKPDLLWIGMTAPKQEKWTYRHWQELHINCHVGTIGAVFDFFAGTAQRAPLWWQEHGLEWLYRLIKEPRRMWRRYVIGNPLFIWNILKEKYDR